MLKHRGTSIIETERLLLRPFAVSDGDAMFNNWANDPEVTKYLSWFPHESIDSSRKILQAWTEEYIRAEFYQWAIVLMEVGEVIGSISVVDINAECERCEIGYCIGKAHWNQGIMTEALRRVLEFMVGEVDCIRVQAVHDVDNPASGRVMLKAGMSYEGRLRKYMKNKHGQFVDCDVYAFVKNDLR